MSNIYYHWAPMPLQDGAVIEIGNFNRIVFGAQLNSFQPEKALREYVFEAFRKKHYPNKPSRKDCCFVFKTIDDARLAIQYSVLFINSILYEVVPVNDNCIFHDGDSCFGIWGDVPLSKGLYDLAHKYWLSKEMSTHPHFERILQSPIRIIKKIGSEVELGFLKKQEYNLAPILPPHPGDKSADIFTLLDPL